MSSWIVVILEIGKENIKMKKLTDFDKEEIRAEVQNAICENLNIIEVIDYCTLGGKIKW